MLQKIEIIGNLVQDAELKSGKEGKEFISFRVAVSEQSGEDRKTTYYDVICGRSGVLNYLKKGQPVYVSGRLSVSAISKDGKAFLNASISAKDLVLIGGTKDNWPYQYGIQFRKIWRWGSPPRRLEILLMVVNIMKSVPEMKVTMLYNEAKVEREAATVLAAVNMDGPTDDDIRRTFERYERMGIRAKNISFHMAINPLEGQDNMTDEDIVRFAGKMMEGMGYGNQPYVVYKHEDIERVHYHVLSIRVDGNGRKINDYQERWRCYHLVRDLEAEFDYKVGNKSDREKKSYVDRFDPKKGDTVEQIRQLFIDSLQYRFTTYAQFEQIMRSHGIAVEEHSGHRTTLCLQGLDEKGGPCTRRLSQSVFGADLYKHYSERALANIDVMKDLAMERNRIRRYAAEALRDSGSQAHFRQLLARKGISIRIERDPKTHQITGADIVDHTTKSAFRLSDMGPDFSLEMLRDADASQWEHDTHDSGVDITFGDFLAGLGGRPSKSHEKDIKDDPKKKKKNLRL